MNQHEDSRATRLAVWDRLDEMDADGAIECGRNPLDGQDPTAELIEALVPLVAPAGADRHKRKAARDRLRTWLRRADYWTPFVDLDMVRRIRDFDVEAWERASYDEQAAAVALWLELIGDSETPGEYISRASSDAAANWEALSAADRTKIANRIAAARKRAAQKGN